MGRRGSWQNIEEAYVQYEERMRETEKAVLYRLADGEAVWIPKSQLMDDDEKGTMIVKRWLALEKGLPLFE